MLHTVCQSADCPNRHECFNKGTATMLILGDICTRDCRFCAIGHGDPVPVDKDEPRRVAQAAKDLGLRYVVVTSVTRDDLPDGGAGMFAATVREIRSMLPASTVEVLTPDFEGEDEDIAAVLAAGPHVFNHNVETVRRLQSTIRPAADYDRSLSVLRFASAWSACARRAGKRPRIVTKSGLMVGLGETDEEIRETMRELRSVGCEWLTVGQYLSPSGQHAPVARYVKPERFVVYGEWAKEIGFAAVASAPLVRSSYKADELAGQAK